MKINLKDKSGEGYIDTVIVVLSAMIVIAFAIKLFPVFIAKAELNTFADEVTRQAEISGEIGSNVNAKINTLKEQTGLNPIISWDTNYISGTNKVQLNNEITVVLSQEIDIGFFTFGSFPVTVTAKSSGRSEVYWK